MKFAEKLRSLREAKGWTQKELAVRSDTSQQGVANWERGERVPAFDAVQALCRALGVNCTVFNDCEHAKVDAGRGRGRPPKADAPTEPATGKRKRKGKEA